MNFSPCCNARVQVVYSSTMTTREARVFMCIKCDRLHVVDSRGPGDEVGRGFIAGWQMGYTEANELDCRLFTPTAEKAWADYQEVLKFNAKPLSERVKQYRCPSCRGPVVARRSILYCVKQCRWNRPFKDPLEP